MSYLYVNEDGVVVSIEENRCTAKYKDGMIKYMPIEALEGIVIMGRSQLTTYCMEQCLERGINVSFFSKSGRYFGRLHSTGHVKTDRQRRQCELYDSQFAIDLSKRIISAKLKNQEVVLRRYERSKNINLKDIHNMMSICRNKIENCDSVYEIMGYEGQGAKYYFDGLSQCIKEDFAFHGRSRRPPLDEFNSMIGLGYSVLMNEIYEKIEEKGLNPYFGFMHRDAEKHPTLASDLMEEWRAVIVDATVMSIINGNEITKEEFIHNVDEPGCYLNRKGVGILIKKLEKKFQTDVKYLIYIDYSVDFRHAMLLQVNQLVKAMENEDSVRLYQIKGKGNVTTWGKNENYNVDEVIIL